MPTYTDSLRLTKQDTGSNDGTWGTVLNQQVIDMLDEAIAGRAAIVLSSSDVTLSTANGSTDQARNMILDLSGTLGADVDIIVPAQSKLYVVNNQTSGSFSVTVKVSGQTGVAVPQGESKLLFCDGTDIEDAVTKVSAAVSADSATNASQLNSVSASSYARKDVAQTFTKGQAVDDVNLGTVSGSQTLNLDNGNVFRMVLSGNLTLANPSNPKDGQQFQAIIDQGGSGGDTISYGSKFRFPDGADTALSTGNDDVDVLSCVYDKVDDVYYCVLQKNFVAP